MKTFAKRLGILVGVSLSVLVFLFLAQCSIAPATDNTIAMYDNYFSPAGLTVPLNTTVMWRNSGVNMHTVTSDSGTPLASGDIMPGGTFSYTFTAMGTYSFYCMHHGAPGGVDMAGSITVTMGLGPGY